MAVFKVEGGHRLSGEITPQGAKNEALQIICATLLTKEEVVVDNIPQILDVLQGGLDYVLQLGFVGGHDDVSFLYLRIFIFINGEQEGLGPRLGRVGQGSGLGLGGLGRLDRGLRMVGIGLDLDKAHEELPARLEHGTQNTAQGHADVEIEGKGDVLNEEIGLDADVGLAVLVHTAELAEELHGVLHRLVGQAVDHSGGHGVARADADVELDDADMDLTEEAGEEELGHVQSQGDQLGDGRTGGLFLCLEGFLLFLGKLCYFISVYIEITVKKAFAYYYFITFNSYSKFFAIFNVFFNLFKVLF